MVARDIFFFYFYFSMIIFILSSICIIAARWFHITKVNIIHVAVYINFTLAPLYLLV
ncbi:hypothetical protein EDC94DRAFT_618182 [Helicostylum pulchrum]|nr:hypothetical protein EDC94DRAFT_618182 [Helicostylum pulchrum]